MALARAKMCDAAESARIRALSAAGGRVYEGHHPETRYEPKMDGPVHVEAGDLGKPECSVVNQRD